MIASDPIEPAPTTPERLLALPLSSSTVELEQHDDVDTNESSDFESNPDDDGNTSDAIDVSMLSHKLERVLSTIEEQVEEKRIHQPGADTTSKLSGTADLIQLNNEETTNELEPYFKDDNTNAGAEITLEHSESSLLDDDDPNTAFGDTLLEPYQPSQLPDDDTLENQDNGLIDAEEDDRIYDHSDLFSSGYEAHRESFEPQFDYATHSAEQDDGSDDSTDTAKAGSSYSTITDLANNEPMIASGNTEHDGQETVLQDSTNERDTQHQQEHMHATLHQDPLMTTHVPSDNDDEDVSKPDKLRVDSAFATGSLTPESPFVTSEGASDVQHTSNHDHDNDKHEEGDLLDPTSSEDNGLPESHAASVLPTVSPSAEEKPANMSWIMTTPPRAGQKPNAVEELAPELSPSTQHSYENDEKDDDTSHGFGKAGEGSAVHTDTKTSAPVVEDEAYTTSDTVVGSSTSVLDIMKSYNLCLLYTSPSPRDGLLSRMPSSA